MNSRVYRYRSPGLLLVAVFFLVWGSGATLAVVQSAVAGHFMNYGRDEPFSKAFGSLIPFMLLAPITLCGSIGVFLYCLNARVEVDGSHLKSIDLLGRTQVSADLREIRYVKPAASLGRPCIRVATDRGDFLIFPSINSYVELRHRLEQRLTSDAETPLPSVSHSNFVQIRPKTYRYRFSYLHFFSFLWCGIVGLMVNELVFGNAKGPNGQTGSMIPFVVVLTLFASIGVWMQLTGWIERIELDQEKIRWVDFLGRCRVEAPLNEIIGVTENRGQASAVKIETRRGTIQASQYLWGYRDLIGQIGAILAARQTIH